MPSSGPIELEAQSSTAAKRAAAASSCQGSEEPPRNTACGTASKRCQWENHSEEKSKKDEKHGSGEETLRPIPKTLQTTQHEEARLPMGRRSLLKGPRSLTRWRHAPTKMIQRVKGKVVGLDSSEAGSRNGPCWERAGGGISHVKTWSISLSVVVAREGISQRARWTCVLLLACGGSPPCAVNVGSRKKERNIKESRSSHRAKKHKDCSDRG